MDGTTDFQHNGAVKRIDIVYICSNQDLAQQNLAKLAVTGDRHHGIASRLTLLAKHFRQLTPQGADHALKPVNLISFTPATSFSASWQSGMAEERAILYLLLEAPMEWTATKNAPRTPAACSRAPSAHLSASVPTTSSGCAGS